MSLLPHRGKTGRAAIQRQPPALLRPPPSSSRAQGRVGARAAARPDTDAGRSDPTSTTALYFRSRTRRCRDGGPLQRGVDQSFVARSSLGVQDKTIKANSQSAFDLKTRRWQRLQIRRFLVDVRQDLIIAEFALKLAAGRVAIKTEAPFPNVPLPDYKVLYQNLSTIESVVDGCKEQLASVLEQEELDGFFQRVQDALDGLQYFAENSAPDDASEESQGIVEREREREIQEVGSSVLSTTQGLPPMREAESSPSSSKSISRAQQAETPSQSPSLASGPSSKSPESPSTSRRPKTAFGGWQPPDRGIRSQKQANGEHKTVHKQNQNTGVGVSSAAAVGAAGVVMGNGEDAQPHHSQAGHVKGRINNKEEENDNEAFRLIVREDGTVDWDGVIEGGREVAQFGADLWRRLNAKGAGEEGSSLVYDRDATLKMINQSPRVSALHQSLDKIQKLIEDIQLEIQQVEQKRNQNFEEEKNIEPSAVQENKGESNFIEVAEETTATDFELQRLRREARVKSLELDMEVLSSLLEHEIEQQTMSLDTQRLLIAEFGLLDVNVEAMVNYLEERQHILEDETNKLLALSDSIDEDELAVLESQIKGFKDRIGLTQTNMLQVDLSSVTKFLKDTIAKLKLAIEFYALGTKLLGNDIQYAGWLIARAFNGDTLKPREARMLQRTAKDLFTLVPFTIILLIPLSPIGHVLVFSAIQKYFPDFYPSPYTERRQNLVRLYKEIEQKLDSEDNR